MYTSFLNTPLTIFLTLAYYSFNFTQPSKGEFIEASIGLGLTAPYEDIDTFGSGFYTQGEYVLAFNKWIGLRPYIGLILTSPDSDSKPKNLSQYKVYSKALLIGGKIRVALPIPSAAQHIETGAGGPFGSLLTYIPETKKTLMVYLCTFLVK